MENKSKHPTPLLLIKKSLSRPIDGSDKLASGQCNADAASLAFSQQFHGAGSLPCNLQASK